LGHTFGHALETVAGLGSITHGAAVAWGIGRCVELCFKKDYCREAFKNEIFDILKLYNWETVAVPSVVKGGGIGQRFLSVMHKDKKNLNDNIRIVLQKGIKDTVVEEVSEKDILMVLK
jgi:3-dehydroquinate synthase